MASRIQQLNDEAVERTRQRAAFMVHALVYIAINGIVVWGWSAGGGGFFWPIVLIVAWGVGLVMHGYRAFGSPPRTIGAG